MKKEFVMSNGKTIPAIGYGTWRTPDGEVCVEAVKTALKAGYTHLDCAAAYKNEISVGKALKEAGINREDIFITSKVWNSDRGYDKVMAAFEKTISELGVDYLDLYLIHWPANHTKYENWDEINQDSWRAMVDLYKAGKCKAIGVSNFLVKHLDSLMKSEIVPMVDQLECHPGFLWKETIEFCQNNGIIVEAWSPLGSGRVLEDETLIGIAEKYNKSVGQLCVRYLLQKDILPLPKSLNAERMASNLDVYDFEIGADDMAVIDGLEIGFSGSDPDEVTF